MTDWKDAVVPKRGTTLESAEKDWAETSKSLRMSGVPAEIQTQNFPNTSLDGYYYMNLTAFLVSIRKLQFYKIISVISVSINEQCQISNFAVTFTVYLVVARRYYKM
jgi:hypothetical protein